MLTSTRNSPKGALEKKYGEGIKNVTTLIVDVTPDLARTWMANKYHKQRHLRTSKVTAYANMMKEGKWYFDGMPIRFDVNDDMIDGQHRLQALIEAGITLPFLVVSGLQTYTFLVMDSGIKRDARDVCFIAGYDTTKNVLSRFARLVVASNYGEYDYSVALQGITKKVHLEDVNYVLTGEEVYWDSSDKPVYFMPHKKGILPLLPPIAEIFNTSTYGTIKSWFGAGDSAFLYWYLFLVASLGIGPTLGEEEVKDFFFKVEEGAGLDPGSPILKLRKKLSEDKLLEPKLRRNRITKAAFFIKTWNAHREGKTMKNFRFGSEELFPAVK